MNKLAYIDLETSGPNCYEHDIIRFNAVIINTDGEIIVFDRYAKPREPLSPEVEALTGINQVDVEICEVSDIVRTEFLALLQDSIVVGYNLEFYEKFLKTTFTKKVEVTRLNRNGFENNITDLSELIRNGIVSTINIQRALLCGYPAARRIIDSFELCIKNKNNDINFLDLTDDERADHLESLVLKNLCYSGYEMEVIFKRLCFELFRIHKLNLITDFLVAKAVADTLISIADSPSFFGIGCCSFIAYILGITGEKLDPIKHGLIFELGFPQSGNTTESVFGFYVEQSDCDKLISALKKQFGETVTLIESKNELNLSVGEAKIKIITAIDSLQEQYLQIDKMIDTSRIAVFQEDYMCLLHLVSGYSYDDINDIRKSIEKNNKKAIDKYRNEFQSRSNTSLSLEESDQIFDDLKNGLCHASCKACVLSAKVVLNEMFPF